MHVSLAGLSPCLGFGSLAVCSSCLLPGMRAKWGGVGGAGLLFLPGTKQLAGWDQGPSRDLCSPFSPSAVLARWGSVAGMGYN